MNEKLLSKFDKLENRRTKLLSSLQKFEDEILNRCPAENKWSPMQVVHHLITSERLSLIYIGKKLQSIVSLEKSGIRASFNSSLLNFFLKLPFRYKAPAMVAEVPDQLNFEDAKEQWDKIRADFKKLLEDYPPDGINKNIYKHPFAGRMNILQALDFIDTHFARHSKQIEKKLQHSKK